MRNLITIIALFISAISPGQKKYLAGKWTNGNRCFPQLEITLNSDSTFEYLSTEHPIFYRRESFSEKGKWIAFNDTVILNPHLLKKTFVQSEFKEEVEANDTSLFLTFNHVKRYYDSSGNLILSDTEQIKQLDFAFNELKRKRLTRVEPHISVRCLFAGYIPKEEIITNERTVAIKKTTEPLNKIFVGCYELQGTKEFQITNQRANHFTLTVYSNYYPGTQIRQMKMLLKKDKVLYTRQKDNGDFFKDNFWFPTNYKVKRMKGGSRGRCALYGQNVATSTASPYCVSIPS